MHPNQIHYKVEHLSLPQKSKKQLNSISLWLPPKIVPEVDYTTQSKTQSDISSMVRCVIKLLQRWRRRKFLTSWQHSYSEWCQNIMLKLWVRSLWLSGSSKISVVTNLDFWLVHSMWLVTVQDNSQLDTGGPMVLWQSFPLSTSHLRFPVFRSLEHSWQATRCSSRETQKSMWWWNRCCDWHSIVDCLPQISICSLQIESRLSMCLERPISATHNLLGQVDQQRSWLSCWGERSRSRMLDSIGKYWDQMSLIKTLKIT